MTPHDIERCFTTPDGTFHFARRGRPVAPVVFGVDDTTLDIFKDALHSVALICGQSLAETDPELGANQIIMLCRDWSELAEVPHLDKITGDLGALLPRLHDQNATHFRRFRFDPGNAIKAGFSFIRMTPTLSEVPAETIALTEAVHMMLSWSKHAFDNAPPVAQTPDGVSVVRPEIAALLRAAYDAVLPDASLDPAHALRLSARANLIFQTSG